MTNPISKDFSPVIGIEEFKRLETRAECVRIVRDDWGIAHVHGATDADAVFGLMYAQAEDDFNRVETNYLIALGRLSEAEGESALYQDLRVRLFVDHDDLRRRCAASPDWLRALMDAWADGLNYYLAVHPKVAPRVIRHFEPWMALSFADGGVLGDIARVSVEGVQEFYGKQLATRSPPSRASLQDSLGSNAFAIAPSNTLNGHALLLINPHPDFYFRSEVQMQSDQGLNCYGAATWGQFFIYQGFNERLGWAHTTGGADTVDEYAETILERNQSLFYSHGGREREVERSQIDIAYRTAAATLAHQVFTVYRTHHGPIVREAQGRWMSCALMYKPVETLTQSFLRMKARNDREFREVSALKANSVANTVYADTEGNIAYSPPHFIPRRDDSFDFTQPVDGADPRTDWQGDHELAELPQVFNPPNGWIANTNDWPYAAAGTCSPKPEDYPRYMDMAGENPRGVNAARVLNGRQDFTLASLVAAAYDPYLSAFARLIPTLVAAFDGLSSQDALKSELAEPIALLRGWDYCQSLDSTATSLAVFWGEQVFKDIEPLARQRSAQMAAMLDYYQGRLSVSLTFRALNQILDYIAEDAAPELKLTALMKACGQLTEDFGSWRTPWGEINRFQRLRGDVVPQFDDSQPSTPVALTSSVWGCLASYKTRRGEQTKRLYGISGNGFVAAVEFAEKVRAIVICPGGASSDPASPHFNDQGSRFVRGELREVYFYPEQLRDHTERSYRPGKPESSV